jgi:hypothetical protein
MPTRQIRQAAVGMLRAHRANAHAHSKKQIAKIARSLRQFGFTVPIIVDEINVILAGHGRWLAAQHLGLELVPVVVLLGLSDAELRAYLPADKELAPLLADAGLYFHLTGFEPAEIDALIVDLIDPKRIRPTNFLTSVSDRSAAKVTCCSFGRHRLRTPHQQA